MRRQPGALIPLRRTILVRPEVSARWSPKHFNVNPLDAIAPVTRICPAHPDNSLSDRYRIRLIIVLFSPEHSGQHAPKAGVIGTINHI